MKKILLIGMLLGFQAQAKDGYCFSMIDTMVYNLEQSYRAALVEAPNFVITVRLGRLHQFSLAHRYIAINSRDFWNSEGAFKELNQSFTEVMEDMFRSGRLYQESLDWMMRSDKARGYVIRCYVKE